MASLNIKSFVTLVQDQVAAIQGAAAGLVDLSIGSLLRSVVESNAGVVQWLQQLIVTLLATTRAATCSEQDLDSWMADFGFTRLPAAQAIGAVTFSRFTPSADALIPIGATVTTGDGSQTYTVTVDATNPAYSSTLGGYVVPPGVTSVTVPVVANAAGAAGNAQAGTVTVISAAIPSVDTATNGLAFAGGADAEKDGDFRARFVLWVASLSKATAAAIGYAIASLQAGVSYTLTENQDINGTPKYGYFTAVIDDGTGMPSGAFLASAANAIDVVRPFTVGFGVFPPTLVPANVAMTIATDPAADHATVVGLVRSAVAGYINALRLGQLLPYTQVSAVAYGASPYVINVSGFTLNGGTADVAATSRQVVRAGTVAVS